MNVNKVLKRECINIAVICMIVCVQQCSKLGYNLIALNWIAYLKYNIIALNYFLSKRKEYAANICTGYVSYDYTLKNTKKWFLLKSWVTTFLRQSLEMQWLSMQLDLSLTQWSPLTSRIDWERPQRTTTQLCMGDWHLDMFF